MRAVLGVMLVACIGVVAYVISVMAKASKKKKTSNSVTRKRR